MTAIIGSSCKDLEAIVQMRSAQIKVILDASSAEMRDAMEQTDLAVASGGVTLYELASIGVPTIAVILVENQIEDTVGMAKFCFG